jgi:TM2 domain-containing membrane protein YozV
MTDINDVRLQMTFQAQKKSTGAAYLLWFFVGGFGGHRFYLGQMGTGAAQLALLIFGWIPLFAGWAVLGISLFIDLFLIPGMIQEQNMKLVNSLTGVTSVGTHRATASIRH